VTTHSPHPLSTPASIRDLYPDLSEQEAAEAEARLDQYLSLVLRILERMEAEAKVGQLTYKAGTLPSNPHRRGALE
jgi:hypothetical protein